MMMTYFEELFFLSFFFFFFSFFHLETVQTSPLTTIVHPHFPLNYMLLPVNFAQGQPSQRSNQMVYDSRDINKKKTIITILLILVLQKKNHTKVV